MVRQFRSFAAKAAKVQTSEVQTKNDSLRKKTPQSNKQKTINKREKENVN